MTQFSLLPLLLALLCSLGASKAAGARPDVIWYVSATSGTTDLATCGRTVSAPCRGIATIIRAGCHRRTPEDVFHTTLILLPGVHIVPVFSSPVVLEHCTDFTVKPLVDVPGSTTIMADPLEVLRPPNATFNRDSDLSGVDYCPLEDYSRFFGGAAFSFQHMRRVKISSIDFGMKNFNTDVLMMLFNVSDFTLDRCRFLGMQLNRRALGIFNPAGPVLIENCTFGSFEQEMAADEVSGEVLAGYVSQSALVYYLASYNSAPMSSERKLVQIVGCSFIKECKHPLGSPSFRTWSDYRRGTFFPGRLVE